MTSGVGRRGARAIRPCRAAQLSLVLLVAALGACVTPPDAPPDGTTDAAMLAARREAAAAAFDTFRVRGGLGVWNDERSVSARIDWRQRGEALDVGLIAPLGLGTARLVRETDGGARVVRGDGPPITGASADEVLQRALGLEVPVPLGELAAWLRGLPGEGRDVRRDAAGRLESLRWRDAGGTLWQARVLDWTTLDELELPSLVTARGGGYRMRLVLRDWSPEVGDGAFVSDAAAAEGDEELAPGAGADAPRVGRPTGAPRRLPIPSR